MNDITESAIRSRPAVTEQSPAIYCNAGVIATRPSNNDDWTVINEAALLPLVAQQDFVVGVEVFLAAKGDQPPSEQPEATEAVVYHTIIEGKLTEMWVSPIHRGDQGEITYGEPWELFDPMMTSSGAIHLMRMAEAFSAHPIPRDHQLEMELATVLAAQGHMIMWETPPQMRRHPTS